MMGLALDEHGVEGLGSGYFYWHRGNDSRITFNQSCTALDCGAVDHRNHPRPSPLRRRTLVSLTIFAAVATLQVLRQNQDREIYFVFFFRPACSFPAQ